MAIQEVKRKEVRYLNKDFSSLRKALINFAKIYYPNTYQNFNETSTGMMFIEMAAYVGDVLSYYIDDSLKESLLIYAEEEKNIFSLAQALGYKPKLSFPATTEVEVYQIIPSKLDGSNYVPNYDYALIIDSNMQISSNTDSTVIFRTLDVVNFGVSSSYDETEVAVYDVDDTTKKPTYFLLKKTVKATAGEIKETEFIFDDPERFKKVLLPDEDIIDIIKATDSDGNVWYHVPYLAQDTIFTELENVEANDPELAQYNDAAPYLLKLIKTSRRFISRIKSDRTTELQFGSGISDDPDELIVPNPTNIGSGLFGSVEFDDNPIDPANFLYTKTYGQAPSNTTLTVQYVVGGGLESNVNVDDLVNVNSIEFLSDSDGLDTTLLSEVKNSVAVRNPDAASGGRDGETVEEVRQNALANFATQLRAVTKEDYIARIYSMPSKFGSIAKTYVVQDDQLNDSPLIDSKQLSRLANPLALNLYTLGFDADKKLISLNQAVKENLKVYLGQHRMLTDGVNIKNGFVINIGIRFTIIIFKNYNKREVTLRCVETLRDFFDVEKWQFNQPIVLADLQRELFTVEGISGVQSLEIFNNYKTSDGYSGNIYDIKAATKDNIVYPSLDPSIFEIRYPNKDIIGRAL